MPSLFSKVQQDAIEQVARKSNTTLQPSKPIKANEMNSELKEAERKVLEYFKDANSILITSVDQLHSYVDKIIEYGYAGIDTETTGLNRIKDTIVGSSLYVPGMFECYIPNKHRIPIFDEPYKDQLTYEECSYEFERIQKAGVKLIFANADFDLGMINKDYQIDFNNNFFYDVILAWRCIKEDEQDNTLKSLYNKYVLKGTGDPMHFSDFFSPKLFPYSKPEIAKLYAANDAKITFDLFKWQLPYITADNPKCIKKKLESISNLIWDIEVPMTRICQNMHRRGIYVDRNTSVKLSKRYDDKKKEESQKLARLVQDILDNASYADKSKCPFKNGSSFNPNSSPHVMYLCKNLMKVNIGKSADKETLTALNQDVTNQILNVRNLVKLVSTYVEKLPKETAADDKIHARFNSVGASTGRMSSADPNLQNIPSHATDIRHLFRATPSSINPVNMKFEGDTISVSLRLVDSIETDAGFCKISELKSGDIVKVVKNRTDIMCKLLSIEDDPIDLACVRLKFDISSAPDAKLVSKWKISVKNPAYVLMSSDYSQQEPKLTAYVSQDATMCDAFQHGKDIYATIASIAFNLPYEKCLEFHPETHEYQPDGKARRGEAKTIVLGICYGRSVVTIADQLFGTDTTLSDDEKIKKAQKVYDSVLNAFPQLRTLMISAQNTARKLGYVETILGRRRHIPDMQLPEFEFKPLKGYVNPDIDPLDVSTLNNKNEIPKRVVDQLMKEFKGYKYFGQIAKRTKELYEEGIKVVNNRPKITEASRKCVNSIIQGSAAELTKMAMILLDNNPEWNKIGGRLLVPVHDELIAEVPIENYERGIELLSSLMSKAGDFLPFSISCDVETTYRWYGLEYPCPYTKPESIDTEVEDEIKWIQYHLFEMEYQLPIFKNSDGSKPRGDAAKGVNGVISQQYTDAIADYIKYFKITKDQFIDHIHLKVDQGI